MDSQHWQSKIKRKAVKTKMAKIKTKIRFATIKAPYLLSFTLTSLYCTVLCCTMLCCAVLCLSSALHIKCCRPHLPFLLPICYEVLLPSSSHKHYSLLCSLLLTFLFLFMIPYYRNPKRRTKIKRVKRAVSSPLRVRKNLPQPLPQLLPRRRAATR